MQKFKAPVVLYWIDGAVITPDQQTDMLQYGPNTRVRNAQHDTKDGALEPMDFMAGPAIPARYTDATLANGQPNPFKAKMAVPYAEWLKEATAKMTAPGAQEVKTGSGAETAAGTLFGKPKLFTGDGAKAENAAGSVAAGDQKGATTAMPGGAAGQTWGAGAAAPAAAAPAPSADPFADPAAT